MVEEEEEVKEHLRCSLQTGRKKSQEMLSLANWFSFKVTPGAALPLAMHWTV